jgi:hypothetical protein
MPAIQTIKFRRGTASQWSTTNPVLAAGEMGLETDTRKFKFGNGTSQWNSISYASAGGSSGGGFFVAETAPVGPNIGDIWYCSADTGDLAGKSFIRYDGYWVELNPGTLGPKGEDGSQGIQGIQGIQGVQGIQGIPGVVAADAPITYNSSTQTVGITQSGITIAQSQVTNLTTDLAGKAATVHTHAISDVTGLQPALDDNTTLQIIGAY